MDNFEEDFNSAKQVALSKTVYVAARVLLETNRYIFQTDEYGRWLFVTDKNTETNIIVFVPLTGDFVVDNITVFSDNSGFTVSGWMGEADYLFETCFNELGKYSDIMLLA
ncbi:MAG: hypothetical protein KIS94_06890 [Chitinophagales bacterium]|nr:hypothetical protein [Chitinophagales bacterium]